MIERYSRKEMLDVWSNENKFNAWMKVELLSSEAFSKLKMISRNFGRIVELMLIGCLSLRRK